MRLDYNEIARAIHRASAYENGRTAIVAAFQQMAEEIAEVFSRDPKFDRKQFMDNCALS